MMILELSSYLLEAGFCLALILGGFSGSASWMTPSPTEAARVQEEPETAQMERLQPEPRRPLAVKLSLGWTGSQSLPEIQSRMPVMTVPAAALRPQFRSSLRMVPVGIMAPPVVFVS